MYHAQDSLAAHLTTTVCLTEQLQDGPSVSPRALPPNPKREKREKGMHPLGHALFEVTKRRMEM
jgi:hypothetical protein